ncbi:hypothetical protein [Absidia glauca]|uniref:Uncharacterized protein n=1 Tax=Absidia glauca TaxID=4829 RepID=A0A168NIY7_ABSGL|nr:hypothetical protein [Absidia glauca]
MLNLMVGCVYRLQGKSSRRKWDFFQGDGLSFFQMAGFEQLNLCSTESPNDHYQRKAETITTNAGLKRSLPTQSLNDHYQRRAQMITTNAELK